MKNNASFITFDIVDFYPSVNEDLMVKAFDFSARSSNITDVGRRIIIYARQANIPLLQR